MKFIVWDNTPQQKYNACKLVQLHLQKEYNKQVNISEMSVTISHIEDDRLTVEVNITEVEGYNSQLQWTKEALYQHSKRFWYSNVSVDELMRMDNMKVFTICDGDNLTTKNRRVRRYVRDLSKGKYGKSILKDEYEGLF